MTLMGGNDSLYYALKHNPLTVEMLMGFPIGWTDFEPLEMP